MWMKAICWYLITVPLLVLHTVFLSKAQTTGPGVSCLCLEEIAYNQLVSPVAVGHVKDGSGRIYVAEQRGYIWIYLPDGSNITTPFLNQTGTDLALTLATGIMNFAFHPNYVTNGLLYVHYTALIQGEYYQRISEFARSATNPDVIDISTERVLMNVFQEEITAGHHGGGLQFGIDGYLYAAFCDVNCCDDPFDHGQNKSTYPSTMVRIDVDSRTGNLPYGIPPDNPFLDEPDTLPEIYAYGFRNPYSSGFDEGNRNTGEGRGRIFLGDVGDDGGDEHEEVNLLSSGGNYGWPVWEGDECDRPEECTSIGPVVFPVVSYNRTLGSCVIFGGIYRGCTNPDLEGWMIYSDLFNGLMGAKEVTPDTWEYTLIPMCDPCPADLTNELPFYVQGIGLDEAGDFYLATSDYYGGDDPDLSPVGSVYKLIDPNNRGTPCPISAEDQH